VFKTASDPCHSYI